MSNVSPSPRRLATACAALAAIVCIAAAVVALAASPHPTASAEIGHVSMLAVPPRINDTHWN